MTKKELLKHLKPVVLNKIEKNEYETVKSCTALSYLHIKVGEEFFINVFKAWKFFTELKIFSKNALDQWDSISYILFITNPIHKKFRKIRKDIKTAIKEKLRQEKLEEQRELKMKKEQQLLEQQKREEGKIERIYTRLFENI